MHLTLLHVPNLGVEVSFIVEAIFIFGLSSFREVGRSKPFFFVLGVRVILFVRECIFFLILGPSVAQLSSAFHSLSCFPTLIWFKLVYFI